MSMKIHASDWVGVTLYCDGCDTRFTLEAGDEATVKYKCKSYAASILSTAKYYDAICPRCDYSIRSEVWVKKNNLLNKGFSYAYRIFRNRLLRGI
jgi:hypothetical protein